MPEEFFNIFLFHSDWSHLTFPIKNNSSIVHFISNYYLRNKFCFFSYIYVSEVVTGFEYFQPGFVLEHVQSTTRRVLSNDVIRVSTGQTILPKKSKYCNFVLKFQHQIRLGTCSRCFKYNLTSSIERCNQFFIKLNLYFLSRKVAPQVTWKFLVWVCEKLITLFDRARQVVLGTCSWKNSLTTSPTFYIFN
jgi:hypothetical protein